ncbi:MAG: S8 family serine peptidase, partial [Rubrobacter sp.]
MDTDPWGAPYVAGELLIAYKPGTSGEAEQDVARRSGGRTVEDLPGEIRLVSFPDVQSEQSEETREQELQNELEDIRDDPRVEAADYNYIREATFIPDDRRFGDPGQWGLRKARFPNAWNDARGTGSKIAIIDSGISQDHPDI